MTESVQQTDMSQSVQQTDMAQSHASSADSSGSPDDSSNNSPTETEVLSMEDINNINVVDDKGSPIDTPTPSQEQLNLFRENLMKMTPEERKTFLANLAKIRVNPDNQQFGIASKKDIMRERLKRRKMELKNQRRTKGAQKYHSEKKQNAKEQYLKKLQEQNGIMHKSEDDELIPDDGKSELY